ncbi:MAG: alpha/beta hydrolase fold domain-containing protein [Solirubrobacterales bacterium]
MVLGTLDAYDTLLSRYVSLTGVPIRSVDYRLAPEVSGTTLAEDVFAGLGWLVDHAADLGVDPAHVAIMGDSGGGGVAAGAASQATIRSPGINGPVDGTLRAAGVGFEPTDEIAPRLRFQDVFSSERSPPASRRHWCVASPTRRTNGGSALCAGARA